MRVSGSSLLPVPPARITPFTAAGILLAPCPPYPLTMVGQEGGPPPPAPVTRFSADGFWWWDGAEWKPALSHDRLWRWTGQGWVPAGIAAPPSGAGQAVGLTVGLIAAFAGVLV